MTTKYTTNFALALPDFRMGPWHDLINEDFIRLDELLFGALSQTNTDTWANSTAYISGITVLDSADATVWMCAIGHTSAALPTTFAQDRTAHPTYWTRLLTGFAPRGEWLHSTEYFPYDLAYQTSLGIFALCTKGHVSNAAGTIKDDSAFWAILCDMSGAQLATAMGVTYSNAASPTLTAVNVQQAIDQLAAQVVSLNSVNVTQGNDIAARMKLAGAQTTTGGFGITPFNIGSLAGVLAPDPMKGNYQYMVNAGSSIIQAPTSDCAIDIMITNGIGASSLTFSGYTVGPNTGDLFTTTNGHKFILSIRRINGISTYIVKALQ